MSEKWGARGTIDGVEGSFDLAVASAEETLVRWASPEGDVWIWVRGLSPLSAEQSQALISQLSGGA